MEEFKVDPVLEKIRKILESKNYNVIKCESASYHKMLQVLSVDWNISGERLASGYSDGMLNYWLPTGTSPSHVKTQKLKKGINQLRWSPISDNIISAICGDGTLNLFDEKTKNSIINFDSGKGEIICQSWHSSADYIAFCVPLEKKASQICLFDLRNGKVVNSMNLQYTPTEIDWSSRYNDILLVGTKEGSVLILNGNTMETNSVHIITHHSNNIQSLRCDRQGEMFATGSSDTRVNLWDSEDISCIKTLYNDNNSSRCVSFSGDGNYIASVSSSSIVISHTLSGDRLGKLERFIDLEKTFIDKDDLWTVSWHPKNSIIAFGGDQRKLSIINLESKLKF